MLKIKLVRGKLKFNIFHVNFSHKTGIAPKLVRSILISNIFSSSVDLNRLHSH